MRPPDGAQMKIGIQETISINEYGSKERNYKQWDLTR